METELQRLINYWESIDRGYLLFSGGMDSCAVLGAAVKAGTDITPVWINNGFGRASEEDIRIQASNLGCDSLKVNSIKPTANVCENSSIRCYHCKSQILASLVTGDVPIFDGTTSSDAAKYRPGKKALIEYEVRSPLAELNISSEIANEIALELGADPLIAELESCLATRVGYDLELTPDRLRIVRSIENLIIDKTGDFNVRCRIDDADHLRIEVSRTESYLAFADEEFRNEIIKLGDEVAFFTTMDLKYSRPNQYDKRLNKDEF